MAETMQRSTIFFIDDNGNQRKINVFGDFDIGRHPKKFRLIMQSYKENRTIDLMECNIEVSRIIKKDVIGRNINLNNTISISNSQSECTDNCTHIRFFWRDESIYIQDIGSKNGTWINNKIMKGWSPCKNSEDIKIEGKVKVTLAEKFELYVQPDIQDKVEPDNYVFHDDKKPYSEKEENSEIIKIIEHAHLNIINEIYEMNEINIEKIKNIKVIIETQIISIENYKKHSPLVTVLKDYLNIININIKCHENNQSIDWNNLTHNNIEYCKRILEYIRKS